MLRPYAQDECGADPWGKSSQGVSGTRCVHREGRVREAPWGGRCKLSESMLIYGAGPVSGAEPSGAASKGFCRPSSLPPSLPLSVG